MELKKLRSSKHPEGIGLVFWKESIPVLTIPREAWNDKETREYCEGILKRFHEQKTKGILLPEDYYLTILTMNYSAEISEDVQVY